MNSEPLLRVVDVHKSFGLKRALIGQRQGIVHAVDGVSFVLQHGQVLAVVGESGSGKTTLAHLVLRLLEADRGTVHVDGVDLGSLNAKRLRRMRQMMQIVFQDPFSSLNPRHTVQHIVAAPMKLHGMIEPVRLDQEVRSLLDQVGLDGDVADRYPNELSGGQRQRVAIARALSVQPSLLVADEPVSSLDMGVQAQILNLFLTLRRTHGLSYLFITHDMSVAHHIADDIAVMFAGRFVEVAPRAKLFASPLHPYTQALLASVPNIDQKLVITPGRVNDAPNLCASNGCPYHPRCPLSETRCRTSSPPLREIGTDHQVACHLV